MPTGKVSSFYTSLIAPEKLFFYSLVGVSGSTVPIKWSNVSGM